MKPRVLQPLHEAVLPPGDSLAVHKHGDEPLQLANLPLKDLLLVLVPCLTYGTHPEAGAAFLI